MAGHGNLKELIFEGAGLSLEKDELGGLIIVVTNDSSGRVYGSISKENVDLMDKNFSTLLHIAVSDPNPDLGTITSLLDMGANVNLRDKNKNTALHIVLNSPNPNVDIIKLLLSRRDINLNIEDSHGETALCLMIKNKELWNSHQFKKVKTLLRGKERDIDYKYRYRSKFCNDEINKHLDGANYLHIAAKAKNKNAFLWVFSQSNVLISQSDNLNGNTPMHDAAESGILLDLLKELIEPHRNKVERISDKFARDEAKGKLRSKEKAIEKMLTLPNNDKCSPIKCIRNKKIQNEIKDYIGMKDPFISKCTSSSPIYTVIAIIAVTTFCIALYFLYCFSPALALGAVVGLSSSGATSACTKLYDIISSDISRQDSKLIFDDNVSMGCPG